MNDVLKDRIWRKLEALPQQQLYQVLDYLEFLEGKYAREAAVRADPLQRFAERLEDGMRMRSVAPKVINGTVGLFGAANRVMRTVSEAGRGILGEDGAAPSRPPRSGAAGTGSDRADGDPGKS